MTTTTQAATDQQVPAKRDFRKEVTDNIVRLLEKGVAPWQKPWEPGQGAVGMPRNPTTDKAYRGGNAIHLLATGLQRGYADPRWMTYKQASEQGWQVRKGEKGTQIEFWDVKNSETHSLRPSRPTGSDGTAGNNQEDRDRPRLIHRIYTVFNANQIDGAPPYAPKEKPAFEAVRAGEQILSNSGAKITQDQADHAFYSRSQDSIHLPPKESFRDPAGYYGTALHELAHWTGHPSRLNRSTLNEAYRFGDTNYAKEELRAELASVFMAAERGVPHDPQQHAAYVGSWIKALKEDKNEIFRAAHDASAATEYLLELERDRSIDGRADGTDSKVAFSGKEAPGGGAQVQTAVGGSLPGAVAGLSDGGSMRETTQHVARVERSSGTVNVHEKQTATDRRSTVDHASVEKSVNSKEITPSSTHALNGAHSIATNLLGESARTYAAQTESGSYRGSIIGETDDHLVQRLSALSAVAHPKDLLDKPPSLGQNVSITYSASKGTVREVHERVKTPDRGR